MLVILIEIVYLYAWASGAIAKFAGMPCKLKFYQKKNGERLKKLSQRKLIVEESAKTENYCQDDIESDDVFANILIPSGWNSQHLPNGPMLYYKISEHMQPVAESSSVVPLRISHCLQVDLNFSWSLFVHHHLLDPKKCNAIKSFPEVANPEVITNLLSKIDSLSICAGQTDHHCVEMVAAKKGKIISHNGKFSAYIDNCITVTNGKILLHTVRTSECELLCASKQCVSCKAYRANLRAMHNKWSKHNLSDTLDSSSHTDDRYLTSPQKKAKIDALRYRVHVAEEEVRNLKEKVLKLSEQGDEVDADLQEDLVHIMNENTNSVREAYAKGTFSRLLWDEQLKATTAKNPCQIRLFYFHVFISG